jgi:hypothetical protein
MTVKHTDRLPARGVLAIFLILALALLVLLPLGCAGAYVGVSVPVGYGPYRPYGGWGGSVGVMIPMGRPVQY